MRFAWARLALTATVFFTLLPTLSAGVGCSAKRCVKTKTVETPAVPPVYDPPVFDWDNGRLRLEILDPAQTPHPLVTGSRFPAAGWIRGLWPQGDEGSVFIRGSWHPQLPLYGFALGFYPHPQLSADPDAGTTRNLCLGVGVVEIKGEEHFHAKTLEGFAWERELSGADGRRVFTARQKTPDRDGYAYELTVRVELPDGADTVLYRVELINTGRRRIESELFAHPFFNAREGFGDAWFSLPGRPEREAVAQAEERLEASGDQLPADAARMSTVLPGGKRRVEIRCDTPLLRAVFWRDKGASYAIEPYWLVALDPGESLVRHFTLEFSAAENGTGTAKEP